MRIERSGKGNGKEDGGGLMEKKRGACRERYVPG